MDVITENDIQQFPPHAAGRNALFLALEKAAFFLRDAEGSILRAALSTPFDEEKETHSVYIIDRGVEFRQGDFTASLFVPQMDVETTLLRASINDKALQSSPCHAYVHSYNMVICQFLNAKYMFKVNYQPDITSAWLELTLSRYLCEGRTWALNVDDHTTRPDVPRAVKVMCKMAYHEHNKRMLSMTN